MASSPTGRSKSPRNTARRNTQSARTGWGQRFLLAIESFTESGRLSRGRRYANGSKVTTFEISGEQVNAKIRGNVNPYYGIYEEPLYSTSLTFETIAESQWHSIVEQLTSRASALSQLLVGEMPDNIEDIFEDYGEHLFPHRHDFTGTCDCPDWENPCKHIAGLFHLLAREIESDPIKLFELRGLSRTMLQESLAKSPLGNPLSQALTNDDQSNTHPADSLHTRPKFQPLPDEISLKAFWQGNHPTPSPETSAEPAKVPAILIKKLGDQPAFWHQRQSFIDTMEIFYSKVREQNQSLLD